MTASKSSMFEPSLSTRVLKLTTTGSMPWVVCTLDAVPVILARFEDRVGAETWQEQLRARSRAA